MSTVSYGRTVCINYQSERADVTLDVLEWWTENETMQLAKYMVDSALGLKVNANEANRLLRRYYDDPKKNIKDFKLT